MNQIYSQIDNNIINQIFSYFSSGIYFFVIFSFNILILRYNTFNIFFLVGILLKDINYTNSNIIIVIIIYILLSIIVGRILMQFFNYLQILFKDKKGNNIFSEILQYPKNDSQKDNYKRNIKNNYRFILNLSKASSISMFFIMLYNPYLLLFNNINICLLLSTTSLLMLLMIFNLSEIRIINKGLQNQ